MTAPISCPTKFISDKAHYADCSGELVTYDHSLPAYFKATFMLLFGILLVLFTDINLYAAWFLFNLSILKAISVYYQATCWLARRILSTVAKINTSLIVNKLNISIEYLYLTNTILSGDISALTATSKTWLNSHILGKNHVFNLGLSTPTITFIAGDI
ncbi:hypothetical protein H4J46_05355 [Colwellia sp. MB02u-6]|uniref:hypothetical protein n=1 Tax=Colwellia sp. MB02u-6 TaxID=2759824 RepID=UPI0015F41D1D|nr:hypothetical protein [Colwellia sp. MB02u-6]MBA6327370.1 hypothetical protein [Colwellia sp. MB02u-6]